MSAVIPIIAAATGGAGCCSWAVLRRARRPSRAPVPEVEQPAGVRVLGASEVRAVALRAAASEMDLARRIYERSLHFEGLSCSGPSEPPVPMPRHRPPANGTEAPREAGSGP